MKIESYLPLVFLPVGYDSEAGHGRIVVNRMRCKDVRRPYL